MVSIKLMSRVFELAIDQPTKLLLLAIADHANEKGVCWPSVARLAWKTGYSRRQIQYKLAELRASGCLTAIQRAQGGRRGSVVYKVNLEVLPVKDPFPRERREASPLAAARRRRGQW
jgi:hypothetical protein